MLMNDFIKISIASSIFICILAELLLTSFLISLSVFFSQIVDPLEHSCQGSEYTLDGV